MFGDKHPTNPGQPSSAISIPYNHLGSLQSLKSVPLGLGVRGRRERVASIVAAVDSEYAETIELILNHLYAKASEDQWGQTRSNTSGVGPPQSLEGKSISRLQGPIFNLRARYWT